MNTKANDINTCTKGANSRVEKPPTSNIQIQNKSQIMEPGPKTKAKTYDLRERLMLFSKQTIDLCAKLPKRPEFEGIRRQLANAATSIGANFEEADGALTKKDFINKVGISRKEAKETKYWLKLIDGLIPNHEEIAKDIRESEEIICILSSILINSGHKVRY